MKWQTKTEPQVAVALVEYVYPNLASLPQRGSLLERWNLAIKEGCDFMEIPADFIKNQTEMERTGLHLGDMLSEREIRLLYAKDADLPSGVEYILHTDPGIPRRGGGGQFYLPPLEWENARWVESFVDMVVGIERHLGVPAAAIEIHSGARSNSLQSLIAAIRLLHEEHFRATKQSCRILVENKVGQAVANAEDMAMLWRMLLDNGMQDISGIMLDIPNLLKASGKRFASHLDAVPNDSIQGMHIHWRHQAPSMSDPVDWRAVFDKIRSMEHQIKINPEVFHSTQVGETINFCEHILGRWQRVRK